MMDRLVQPLRWILLLLLMGGVAVAWDDAAFADDETAAATENSASGEATEDSSTTKSSSVRGTWAALVPPLLAIGLAIALKDVLVALFVAIWVGVIMLLWSSSGWLAPIHAIPGSIELIIRDCLVEPGDDSHTHLTILFFTLFLGAMVGVLYAGGGMQSLVNKISRFASTRRRGQLATTGLGCVIFFDDYANIMLLGSTMRPVTDRLKISREKLSFLVDATAAPVAGLALISTWVGFEVEQIRDAMQKVADAHAQGVTPDAYSVFLQTLSFRAYPILLIVFLLAMSITGRDFGPMLAAERRAKAAGSNPPAPRPAGDLHAASSRRLTESELSQASIWQAIVPVSVLCGGLAWGMYYTGSQGLVAENQALVAAGETPLPTTFASIVNNSDSNSVMLISSFMASVSAIVMVLAARRLTLRDATDAWIEGARGMVMPISVLVLAWGVAFVCDTEQLDTAGFLNQAVSGNLAIEWMPAITFVLAAAVSFATGTSWGTMAILIPLVTPLVYEMHMSTAGADIAAALASPPAVVLGTIGAVLAGAIFGDHCSPISDTTVLSSAASGCDHLGHVATQLPYALSVAVISLVCCCIPVGWGINPLWCLLAGGVVTVLLVVLVGRNCESEIA